MLTKKEKEVIKSLVKYHLKEVKRDKMKDENIVAVIGAEIRYEKTLKNILKKLK